MGSINFWITSPVHQLLDRCSLNGDAYIQSSAGIMSKRDKYKINMKCVLLLVPDKASAGPGEHYCSFAFCFSQKQLLSLSDYPRRTPIMYLKSNRLRTQASVCPLFISQIFQWLYIPLTVFVSILEIALNGTKGVDHELICIKEKIHHRK